jgi:hypothetical protein
MFVSTEIWDVNIVWDVNDSLYVRNIFVLAQRDDMWEHSSVPCGLMIRIDLKN